MTIGDCIGDVIPAASPHGLCLKNAQNCVDVAKCNGFAPLAPAVCDGRPKGWSCEGSQAIRCGYGAPYYVDCAFHGGACKLYPNADEASTWPCALPEAAKCAVQGKWHCVGTVRTFCEDGLRYGSDCAARKQTCMETNSGATCVRGNEPCSDPFFAKMEKLGQKGMRLAGCSDGRLVTCYQNGYAEIHDCAITGAGCSGAQCESTTCTVLSPDDGPVRCKEECIDGHRMRACLYTRYGTGQPLDIDCRDHGFKSCTEQVLNDKRYTWCK